MVETATPSGSFPVEGDGAGLAETLPPAAAAIADTVLTTEADPKAVRYPTVWVECRCNIGRKLRVGRG